MLAAGRFCLPDHFGKIDQVSRNRIGNTRNIDIDRQCMKCGTNVLDHRDVARGSKAILLIRPQPRYFDRRRPLAQCVSHSSQPFQPTKTQTTEGCYCLSKAILRRADSVLNDCGYNGRHPGTEMANDDWPACCHERSAARKHCLNSSGSR